MQDYSQMNMFAGDAYGAAMDQMNYAPNYAIQPGVGLNLNDLTGIVSASQVQNQIRPQEIIGGGQDEGYDFTMPEEKSYIERITDYISDPSKNVQRGLGTLFLTANPIAALASYFAPNIMDAGGGIFDAFKNFQDRRKGRLDITADAYGGRTIADPVASITAGEGGGYDYSDDASGPTAAGAGMGVGGGYASDFGFTD
jgi:hypothetical protein